MKKSHIVVRSVAGLLLFLMSLSVLSYEVKVCNSCGTPALQFQARDSGNGDYYFYDFVSRKLTHLRVKGVVTPLMINVRVNTTASNGTITNVPITPSEQRDFDAAQAFVDSNGGFTDYIIDVAIQIGAGSLVTTKVSQPSTLSASSGDSVNAFDIVSTPLARTTVGNYLDRNSFLLGMQIGAATFLNYALDNAVINSPINIYTRANFPDHTSAIFVWNFDIKGFEYVMGTAKDALGQHIPENSIDAAGGENNSQTYIYPATPSGQISGLGMVDRLNSFGMGLGFPVNQSGYLIVCTNNGVATACEIRPLTP